MKTCIKCGIKKDETEFYKGRNQCKECIKEYRQKNKERIKECQKEYIEQCTDGYIRRLLAKDSTLNSSDIPQGLIESKRLLIQIERYIKKQTT